MAKFFIDGILAQLSYAQATAADVAVAARAAKRWRGGADFAYSHWVTTHGNENAKRTFAYMKAVHKLNVIWRLYPNSDVRSAFGQLGNYRAQLARAEARQRQADHNKAVVELVDAYVALTLENRSLRALNAQFLQRLLDIEHANAQWKPRDQKSRQ